MINLMDRLFISIGFEKREIKASPIRGWIYFGIIYFLGLTSAFGIMTILSLS